MAASRGWLAAHGWQTACRRAGSHPRAHRPLTSAWNVAMVDTSGRNSATAPSCGENARLVRILGHSCWSRGAEHVLMARREHNLRHAHESAAKSECRLCSGRVTHTDSAPAIHSKDARAVVTLTVGSGGRHEDTSLERLSASSSATGRRWHAAERSSTLHCKMWTDWCEQPFSQRGWARSAW